MLDNHNNIKQRVSILKRFREMLKMQREKFSNYLNILEQEERAIVNNDRDALEAHVFMEKEAIREILSLQKVIVPLDTIYRKFCPNQKDDITQLQNNLTNLREHALFHNAHNRELLTHHRDELKRRINSLNLPKSRKSVYATATAVNMLDISC